MSDKNAEKIEDKVVEIIAVSYNKWKEGTGEAIFLTKGIDKFCLTKDQVRELYYRVLGIDGLPDITIDDEIENVRASDFINVDVPEDILKVERKFDLEQSAQGG